MTILDEQIDQALLDRQQTIDDAARYRFMRASVTDMAKNIALSAQGIPMTEGEMEDFIDAAIRLFECCNPDARRPRDMRELQPDKSQYEPFESPVAYEVGEKRPISRCPICGRATWEIASVGMVCGMAQPDGTTCGGVLP